MMPFLLATILLSEMNESHAVRLNPPLQRYASAREKEFNQIPDERKIQLNEIAHFIRDQIQANQSARLTFICTHNSRRSHLAQIWAKTAAEFYGVSGVETFSGGTEATAFNPRAVRALERAGFAISPSKTEPADNPRYQVRFHEHAPSLECFSKVYDQPPNPRAGFCAVMTCSQADMACPLVAGAALRVALPYDDPKQFDGRPDEPEHYDERCRQIAREMLYALSKVANE